MRLRLVHRRNVSNVHVEVVFSISVDPNAPLRPFRCVHVPIVGIVERHIAVLRRVRAVVVPPYGTLDNVVPVDVLKASAVGYGRMGGDPRCATDPPPAPLHPTRDRHGANSVAYRGSAHWWGGGRLLGDPGGSVDRRARKIWESREMFLLHRILRSSGNCPRPSGTCLPGRRHLFPLRFVHWPLAAELSPMTPKGRSSVCTKEAPPLPPPSGQAVYARSSPLLPRSLYAVCRAADPQHEPRYGDSKVAGLGR